MYNSYSLTGANSYCLARSVCVHSLQLQREYLAQQLEKVMRYIVRMAFLCVIMVRVAREVMVGDAVN